MDLSTRLAAAEDILHRAGDLAHRYFRDRGALRIEAKRHMQDLLSAADREVETLIRSASPNAFPMTRSSARSTGSPTAPPASPG